MIDKINLPQTLDRWTAFMEHRMNNGIMAVISTPDDSGKTVSKKIGQAKTRECMTLEEIEKNLSERIQSARNIKNSLSDIIPTIYPTLCFGESVWSGFFGGKITFSGTEFHTWSSCTEPVINSLISPTYHRIIRGSAGCLRPHGILLKNWSLYATSLLSSSWIV